MGIDRISHGIPPASITDVAGPPKESATQAAFSLSKAAPTSPAAALHAPSAGALERFQSGEIDLGGYVDLKVNEATAHLSNLPPVELRAIQSALRERLAGDPSLVDLLRNATGEILPARDD